MTIDRERVIATYGVHVPSTRPLNISVDDKRLRLWRDDTGAVQVEELAEAENAAVEPRVRPAVEKIVPTDVEIFDHRWYAAYTDARREDFALDGLRGTGLLCYAPQELRIIRHARQEMQVQRPLFPRYCFIGVPPRSQVELAYGVRGVSWLLGGWERPSVVSICAILELAMAERAGMFDHTKPRDEHPAFVIGQEVRFLDGPLVGRMARVAEAPEGERIVVFLGMFGQEVRVQVDAAQIEAVE